MKQTEIIRRAIITEKSSILREGVQIFTFEVAMAATKVDIRRAVEQLLGAKVESVRTAVNHGKVKRQGRFGRKPIFASSRVRRFRISRVHSDFDG